jgi:hypothetical protein
MDREPGPVPFTGRGRQLDSGRRKEFAVRLHDAGRLQKIALAMNAPVQARTSM